MNKRRSVEKYHRKLGEAESIFIEEILEIDNESYKNYIKELDYLCLNNLYSYIKNEIPEVRIVLKKLYKAYGTKEYDKEIERIFLRNIAQYMLSDLK